MPSSVKIFTDEGIRRFPLTCSRRVRFTVRLVVYDLNCTTQCINSVGAVMPMESTGDGMYTHWLCLTPQAFIWLTTGRELSAGPSYSVFVAYFKCPVMEIQAYLEVCCLFSSVTFSSKTCERSHQFFSSHLLVQRDMFKAHISA